MPGNVSKYCESIIVGKNTLGPIAVGPATLAVHVACRLLGGVAALLEE